MPFCRKAILLKYFGLIVMTDMELSKKLSARDSKFYIQSLELAYDDGIGLVIQSTNKTK